jgi:CheY-like chemotaxis protein
MESLRIVVVDDEPAQRELIGDLSPTLQVRLLRILRYKMKKYGLESR